MKSVLFKAVNSNVENVFQFKDEADLKKQLNDAVNDGRILVVDRKHILGYLASGYRHIAINYTTLFEITDVDVEPELDRQLARVPNGKRNRSRNGSKAI